MILCNDVIIHICEFISTSDLLSLSSTCSDFRSIILFDVHTMKNHTFTVLKEFNNLKFLEEIPFKIFNLRLQCNSISDEDFTFIRGIHKLDMRDCNQETITDKAFENLKGIHTLDMSWCNQKWITDKAFENLKGIHSLNIRGCSHIDRKGRRCKGITDKAFENLKGIHTLDMSNCKQRWITDKAFENLKGIHILIMRDCNKETITDKAFENLKGIHTLRI